MTKDLTCADTHQLLGAFHDRELAVADEIAVSAHLEWCEPCAQLTRDFRALGSALRVGMTYPPLVADDAMAFSAAVVTRAKTERDHSFSARVHVMLDDMHLLYASCGAVIAATVCVVTMLGMMRFAADNRPDSLGAIVNVLSMPLECEATVGDAAGECRMRWAQRFQRSNDAAEEDAVFTLDSVLMRQGRLVNLAVLRASKRRAAFDQVQAIEALLDAVSRARLDVQSVGVSDGMVRVVDRATVRANKQQANDLPLPNHKKRAASHPGVDANAA